MNNQELELKVKELAKIENFFDLAIAVQNLRTEYKDSEFYKTTRISFDKIIEKAKEILSTEFEDSYKALRKTIDAHGADLNRLIGMQLDVANYFGKSWERGCTLETIDRCVTDRKYLLDRIEEGADADKLTKLIKRNDVNAGEYYFSFALDGMGKIAQQDGEYYMDFRGDTPKNDGTYPMSLISLYDHYSMRFDYDVEKSQKYILEVTYFDRKFKENAVDFCVCVNGEEIYHGTPYSGKTDEKMKDLLPDGFIPAVYEIPAELTKDGRISVVISEPTRGFLVSEFRIVKGE